MSNNHQLPLSVQPIISYPREAEVGKTYLMTIDLQTSGDDWPYEEEEYPIYCMLETSPLFSSKPVGEPAVVLHRFGGTYGAAQFLLTAAQEEIEGEIRVTLVNRWGLPVNVFYLPNLKIISNLNLQIEQSLILESNSQEYRRYKMIEKILQKRHSLSGKIMNVEEAVRNIAFIINNIEMLSQILSTQVENPDILEQLRAIKFSDIRFYIYNRLNLISELRRRFSRHTLNLGVIGRSRQGKSRFLQSLTGLTADVIPDGYRLANTGVRSTIYHNPDRETYAQVWFHSESSLLKEVIAPYFRKLELGSMPQTLKEFAAKPLPQMPYSLLGSAVLGAMYEHLRRYNERFNYYYHLLSLNSPQRIPKEQIREYVAQDTPDSQRTYFNYLAVRKVEIFCCFPNTDLAHITLVDMPGLGDTGLSDEQHLLRTLANEIDAVLFVRMPRSSGDFWTDVDVSLYDTARTALVELPLELWSFMILNRTASDSLIGDNSRNCYDLANTISEAHINVVDCIIADCTNCEEVYGVLDRVLNYLVVNITSLDQQYLSLYQQEIAKIHELVMLEVEKAKQIRLDLSVQSAKNIPNEQALFLRLAINIRNDLSKGLQELIGALKKSSSENCKQYVNRAIQLCYENSGIPSIEQIEQERVVRGSYTSAYCTELDKVRMQLKQNLSSIDKEIKKIINSVKLRVVNILIERGKLGVLTQERSQEFIKIIADMIPDDLSNLKTAFENLSTFDLSFRGLIQPRIQGHLESLKSDNPKILLSSSSNSQEILSIIELLYAEVIFKCQLTLEEICSEIDLAVLAMVEEFFEQVMYSEGSQNAWLIFLYKFRLQIWPSEFNLDPSMEENQKDWQNLMNELTKAISNSNDIIKILN